MATFRERLSARVAAVDSLLCVGLDPDLSRPPFSDHRRSDADTADAVISFNGAIIAATVDFACAFKPNLAFYLPLGAEGIRALRATRELIPADVPVILDAKANDLANTAERYAEAFLDVWGFDAVTVNAYLGEDAVEPFLRRAGRGVIVLARTSNPGSGDLQNLPVDSTGASLSDFVVRRAVAWDAAYPADVGLVVGATYPATLERVRAMAPDLPVLLPGVGAQGGDVAASVAAGCDANGAGLLVHAGRSIMYAGTGDRFAEAAGDAARSLRDEINRHRPARRI